MSLASRGATSVSIRPATPSDAAPIAEIHNQAIRERQATFETELRSEAAMRDWIVGHDLRHPVLVATLVQDPPSAHGTIVGWASVSEYRPRACYAGVGEFSVYVDYQHRRHGIGRELLLALIEEARRLGYWKLVSRILPSNASSRALCASCRFREVGVYEKHGRLDGEWLDAVIIERLIPENLV
jgi:phosphinothricin acetyltransferase